MKTFDGEGDSSADSDLFDVSTIEQLTDDELRERHRRITQIERDEFHRHLSPLSFLGTATHLLNEPLDDARRAVEEELRSRR